MTRILITGAAGGIGQALLAEMPNGHDILATDIRQPEGTPESAEYRPLDVRGDDPGAGPVIAPRSLLKGIIQPRVEETLELLRERLKAAAEENTPRSAQTIR